MTIKIVTSADVDEMRRILDSGDRAGAYLYYYNLIKDIDREAANQVMLQMQITTYSGFIGGAALIGNAIAKDSNPNLYPETLDLFSEEIVRGLIAAIHLAAENPSHSGVLTAQNIRDADWGVWNFYEMGHYFPGNIQFSMDGPTFYSEGTLASMLAGLQLTFGSHVGNRADQFAGEGYSREETYEYILIRNVSDGVIVYVEDKLGLVDAATGGLHENSGQFAGSDIRAVASFTRTDGTTSTIADVLLDNDATDTRYFGDTSVSEAAGVWRIAA